MNIKKYISSVLFAGGIATGLFTAPLTYAAQTTDFLYVGVNILKSCQLIMSQDIYFGDTVELPTAIKTTGKFEVLCTAGSPYSVGFDLGTHADGSQRRMQNGSGDYLNYKLTKDSYDGTELGVDWGINTVDGLGASPTWQPYEIYAELPAQATPVGGYFSDVVLVTLQY